MHHTNSTAPGLAGLKTMFRTRPTTSDGPRGHHLPRAVQHGSPPWLQDLREGDVELIHKFLWLWLWLQGTDGGLFTPSLTQDDQNRQIHAVAGLLRRATKISSMALQDGDEGDIRWLIGLYALCTKDISEVEERSLLMCTVPRGTRFALCLEAEGNEGASGKRC